MALFLGEDGEVFGGKGSLSAHHSWMTWQRGNVCKYKEGNAVGEAKVNS